MRIHSNTLLSWPQVLHAFQAARLYQGRWMNYYFYKINSTQPLILTTHSPIEFLQENCQYYCYDNYYRDKRFEQYGNSFELVNVCNKDPQFAQETWVYVPKTTEPDDIIVIRNDTAFGYPSANFRSYFNFRHPALQ
jgi:hypothetical protein